MYVCLSGARVRNLSGGRAIEDKQVACSEEIHLRAFHESVAGAAPSKEAEWPDDKIL